MLRRRPGSSPNRSSARCPEWRPPTAIVINTPHNPTGKVFTGPELAYIAELCVKYDVLAITDEIYEHILYDGA